MKEKSIANASNYFQQIIQLQCRIPIRERKQSLLKHLIKHYQKALDVTFAATIIGAMFLIGIWYFLVQLAEY